MTNKIKHIIGMVVFVVSFAMVLSLGMSAILKRTDTRTLDDLFSGNVKEDVFIEGSAYHATSAYLILVNEKQSFFPVDNEYFFLIFNEDMTKGTILRADKDWYQRLSGEETGFYSVPSGISISGVLQKTDPVFEEKMPPFIEALNSSGYYPEMVMYVINSDAEKHGICVVIAAVIYLIIFVALYVLKRCGIVNPIIGTIAKLAVVANLSFLLYNSYMLLI